MSLVTDAIKQWLPWWLRELAGWEIVGARERVIRALKWKKPDRIPLFLSITPWRSDVVAAFYSPSSFWKPVNHPPGMKTDIKLPGRSYLTFITNWMKKGAFNVVDEFGCIWYNPGNETIGQVVNPRILRTWDDLKTLKMPKKTNKGRWLAAKLLFGLFGKNRYRLGDLGNFFFERMQFLRGFDNLLKDVARNREKVKSLVEKLTDWYCWLVDEWAKRGAEGLIATDDWGTNHNTFISPRTFGDLFQQGYEAVTERLRDHNMHFWLHSCGNIYYLIPKLIESGVDCLQLDSPAQTSLKKLKEFGGKVAFCNVADIDRVIPYKTPKEVEARVLQIIKELGPFNGGLIGTTYADLAALNFPKENMEASVRAYRRFGRYDEYPLKSK
ncbi:MAG TPA: uroporphyrinogen decarboxylase family protein [Candidatus Deferrimicrobium sp.]|nr:uroporphyrinogen decarboxylase family protein [Candidatus Deferrimicrobium sp.]